MVETSCVVWFYFLYSVIVCTFISIKISQTLPWSKRVEKRNFALFFGISVAPFIFGVLSLSALFLFANFSHITHLIFLLVTESFLALILWIFTKKKQKQQLYFRLSSLDVIEKCIALLLILFALVLFINAIFFPLTQNDSLEYSTVGRVLYEKPDLSIYPILNSEQNNSGFYGPWTHPPFYAAMIYTTYVFQGNASYAGLLRLISPWFAICAVVITFAIGALVNRKTGLISALFLISTPLFFLGADSALIDAHPTLGLLLTFSALLGINSSPLKAGAIQGFILGVAMWTHSQAILYLPLSLACIVLLGARNNIRNTIKQCIVLILVSLAIAAYPYINNIYHYGAIVSDNNLVYQFPQLGWVEYFTQSRGISSITAKLQYGVLKGWFATEYFGFIFWLMTCGLILCFFQFRKLTYKRKDNPGFIIVLCLAVVLMYLGGVILSTCMGLDIMIRNERYWLVILPFVSIVSGWFYIECLYTRSRRVVFNVLRYIIIFSFLLLVILQLAAFSSYRFLGCNLRISEIFRPLEDKLMSFSEMHSMDFLKNNTPENAVILATQPANMYYSSRRMVSYLDPRLLPFYKASNAESAVNELRKLGIKYIYLTDYSLPIFYNSYLMDVAANPSFSKLIYSSGTSQIYSLESSQLRYKLIKKYENNPFVWTAFRQYKLLGKKGGFTIKSEPKILGSKGISTSQLPFNLFQRNFSTIIVSDKTKLTVHEGREYIIEYELAGKGYINLYIEQFDKRGKALKEQSYNSSSQYLLGNLVLQDNQIPHKFTRRIRIFKDTDYVQLVIEQEGNSSLHIKDAKLIELTEAANNNE